MTGLSGTAERNAYYKDWRLRHPDAQRKWCEENREHCLQYGRNYNVTHALERSRYREANVEEGRAYSRGKYRQNIEASRAYERAKYYRVIDSTRERVNSRQRIWRRVNGKLKVHSCDLCGELIIPLPGTKPIKYCWKCKANIRENLRKQKGLGLPRGRGWEVARIGAMVRDGHVCRCCGSVKKLIVHHIDDYNGTSGSNRQENLVTLCRSCHQRGNVLQVHYFKEVMNIDG